MDNQQHQQAVVVDDKVVPGWWFVVAMLGVGVLITSAVWFYTDAHTRPFRPLRDAIHSKFPGSVPQVEGGQRKIHKGTARILRVTMQVHEDPREDDDKVQRLIKDLALLADQHLELEAYDQFELYLVWYRPEKSALSRHESRDIGALRALVSPSIQESTRSKPIDAR